MTSPYHDADDDAASFRRRRHAQASPVDRPPPPLPQSYYDSLRHSETATFVPLVRPDGDTPRGLLGRNLHLASDPAGGLAEPVILCHVPTFFRWTWNGSDVSDAGAFGGSAAALMAMRHFNGGDGSVVDELDGIDGRCKIRLTTELMDSMSQDRVAVYQLTELITRPPNDAARPQPCAILGSSWSSVTSKMATVTGVYDLPQVTPSASSTALDDLNEYPLFTRTHPSDAGMARLSLSYLSELLGVTFFGMIYVDNAFGVSYHKEVLKYAADYNMSSTSVSFRPNADLSEIRSALEQLKTTGYNYFLGVFYNPDYERVMGIAGEIGIAGPGRFWLFNGLLSASFVEQSTALKTDSPAAVATFGNAIIHDEGGLSGLSQYDRFVEQWTKIGDDQDAVDYINSKQPHHDKFSFNRTKEFFASPPGHIASFSYDAVVGLGLSACAALNASNVDGIFPGFQHHSEFVANTFLGATGNITIGPGSYSRNDKSTYFAISNILKASEDDEYTSFQGKVWSYFDTEKQKWAVYDGGTGEFTYPDGSAVPPRDIPEQNENMNIMLPAVRGICLSLSAIALCLSMGLLLFTFMKRTDKVILASQPPFLMMICLGTLLMASAIIPFSIDDSVASERGCDIACMSALWLLFIGFCCCFAALFSKLWRINRLFKNARGFKRVKVDAADVIVPFIVLLCCNIIILTVWTARSPLQWGRAVLQYDPYGRPAQSIGKCVSENWAAYLAPLLAINGVALILALWQAYVARNITTEFSESKYIGMATVCIFQAVFIGAPVIFIVSDQPAVLLFLISGIDFIICCSVLLLIFVPKLILIRKGDRGLPKNYSVRGTNWILSTALGESEEDVDLLKKENDKLRREINALKNGSTHWGSEHEEQCSRDE